MQIIKYVVLGAVWTIALGTQAQDSPNCARPQGWTETTVCANAELLDMHQRMQRLYEDRRRVLDGEAQKDLVSYQRGWLRGRDECETFSDDGSRVSCLKDLYRARLSQLAPAAASGTAKPSASSSLDATVVSCRGDTPSWSMEMGSRSAHLRLGLDGGQRVLNGRLVISTPLKTYIWRGTDPSVTEQTEVVAMLTEENCTLSSAQPRFTLMARVSLPDGNLIAGCCQRGPMAMESTKTAVPSMAPDQSSSTGAVLSASNDKLLAVGTKVRLRNLDGAVVALRKSARISSGNVLTRVRAGVVAQVEQAAVKEGTNWYFIALANSETKGWIMGDLVESLSAERADVSPPTEPTPVRRLENVPQTSSLRLAPVRSPWWRNVGEHASLIDACIDGARVRNLRVVMIEATANGGRQVFMRDALKSRIVCEVSSNAVVKVRALDVGEGFPHASGPLFTRAPTSPPTAKCYRNDRVVEARTRAVVGWNSFLKRGRHCG